MFLNLRGLYSKVSIFLLLISVTSAQESISLSLDEALKLAKERNYDLLSAQADVDAMQADKNKSLAVLLPSITLSETFVRTTDPLNSFGLKLKQETVSQADFNPALLNDPAAIENFNTKAEIKQPLINIDGFFGRAAAADGLSAMKHKMERTRNYITFMVKISYYELNLQEESLDVIEEALEAARANRKLVKDYYDEGMITKADFLKAEVHVSDLESQRLEALNRVKTANDKLLVLLGLEAGQKVVTTDSLDKPSNRAADFEASSIIANRSDILARKYRVESLKNMKTSNWAKFLPRINAFGSYEFNDTEVFGTNAESWMVGLNLQWNVFNGFQNIAAIQKSEAEIKKAKAEYTKAKIEGINDIDAAYRSLETAKQQLALAETAVDQADESLRIINDRYAEGLEKTSDLLIAEATASGTKLKHLQSLYFYNVSLFKLELMLEKQFLKN